MGQNFVNFSHCVKEANCVKEIISFLIIFDEEKLI